MASPFFFVDKKDGKLHPVQDYRHLNDITVKNAAPLPLIPDLIDKLHNTRYFTKLDIRWGYNNIRICHGDEWKVPFKTPLGLFELLVMPFGLCNAPATFQTFMNDIFEDLLDQGHVVIYLDDILIFHDSLLTLCNLTHAVLQCLGKFDLYLKPEKCSFDKTSIEYLGVILPMAKFTWTLPRSLASPSGLFPPQSRKLRPSWVSATSIVNLLLITPPSHAPSLT